MPSLIGVTGTIFMLFLISIVNTALLPFQCWEHPNGSKTVKKYPTILCWDDSQHTSMVAASFIFLLIPLGFVSGAIFASIQYPRRTRALDTSFLHAFAFLFF